MASRREKEDKRLNMLGAGIARMGGNLLSGRQSQLQRQMEAAMGGGRKASKGKKKKRK